MRTILLCCLLVFASNSFAQTNSNSAAGRPSGVFIALSVSDVDSLSKWYQEKLDFTVLKSGEAPNKIARFALLQGEAGILELIKHREAKSMADAAPSIKAPYQLHGIFKVGLEVEIAYDIIHPLRLCV